MADDSISKLRLPPHSLEAEQSLLGGLLIDNEALDKVADIVSVKDFYRQDHQIIYQHIHRLIERSQPADIVTVGESLESNSELNTVGGLEYLGLLAESTPTAANIRGYAQIIRERSIMRSLVEVGTDIVDNALSPQGRDAQQLLDESESKIFQIAEAGKNDRIGFTDIKELLPQVAERIDQLFQRDNPSDVTGIPTGYKDLDMMTSGLQPGDLIIIAGRPSMGKTSLALNICEYVAIDTGLPSAVFSMEMGSTQLVSRLIGSVGKLNQHKMRTGQLDDNDWEKLSYALGQLNEAPIFIDEGSALNPYEVRARARRLHKQCGRLGLIVIDYLQLMGSAGSTENRATEISEISRSLKALAKELNVPVIALSQLNRSVEQRPDKRPVMSDLRESGAIEQDADVIMFIYRDEVYNPETPDKGIAEIILAKQRNGPVGRVKLTFLGEYTKFENYANPVGYDIPD
ncbi:MAG: replicative DNA helicase [Betaproteobacteria bacterium]|jgi:replicative DNA helicase|nr:replicative DNA helicase [Nitrosomonadales bacterium]NCV38595.1 replicative DNA helicase [Betaproteobacteria bacterium]NCV53760.1 replicative DNA helicase [Betaproteobacteria bacterium]NCW63297.1 replicative DNA helicase [Betaproteobacteria bacterium]NCX68325.1 replicative DNA helicase [Betaproteobacteria bacterium]